MKRTAMALAALALLVAAAPAAAKPKPLYYDGKTMAGQELSFTLTGKQISGIDGYLTATCVPTHGSPASWSIAFHPPGSFALGKTRKATETEYMAFKGDVAKNYEIAVRKMKGRVWVADLHVDYSYEEINYDLERRFFICQADDEFRFRV